MSIITILAIAIATLIPIAVLFAIYKLDLYKIGEFNYVMLCFGWGLITYGVIYLINTTLLSQNLVTRGTLITMVAPVLEEVLKFFILIYLIRRPNFTYFVDGAIYGFAIGIGFAVIENYEYVLGRPDASIMVAVGRVLSTNLIHASSSSVIGVAFGLARFERSFKRLGTVLTGLLAAIAIHGAFNNLVFRVSSNLILLYAAFFGLSGAAFIAYMIKRGLAEEKAWIEEKLGVADRVTAGEAAVVHRLEDLKNIVRPIAERLGKDKESQKEKAEQMERFLYIQARLGILRKTLDKLTDEKMKESVSKQMDELRNEMDTARREVGSYGMLYLRNVFPPEASPLWGHLEKAVDAQIEARKAGEGSGFNAFGALSQRIVDDDDKVENKRPEEKPKMIWGQRPDDNGLKN